MNSLRYFNYFSVIFTIILTLLSLFKYHSEMSIYHKISIMISCSVLGLYTFICIPKKEKYGIQDYFFSLLYQSLIFLSTLYDAKRGAYKEKDL